MKFKSWKICIRRSDFGSATLTERQRALSPKILDWLINQSTKLGLKISPYAGKKISLE